MCAFHGGSSMHYERTLWNKSDGESAAKDEIMKHYGAHLNEGGRIRAWFN